MQRLLSDNTERKFIEEFDVSDYEILTEDGYKDITSSKKTIKYDIWKVTCENGHFIECADTHIIIDSNGTEIYAKDSLGALIQTIDGNSKVISVVKDNIPPEHMYDLSVNSDTHTFYSNGILSHNSISSVAYLLWYAIFTPEKTVAILANKGDTAREMLARVTLMLENLPFFLQPGTKVLNKGSLEFSNHSRIIARATSGSSIRGMSVNLLYLDEFAFVERATEFYTSTYPVVSSGKDTKVIITSTANGIGNIYHKLWEGAVQGTNDYKPFRVDWWDVPGRDEEWKKQTIANTSPLQFEQEFLNSFLGTGDTLVAADTLLKLRAKEPIIRRPDGAVIYTEPEKGHEYITLVDVAKGRGQDYSTFNVIDVTSRPWKQVAVYRNNIISPILFPDIIYKYAKSYNESLVVVENNDSGQVVCNGLYYDLEYENMFLESSVKANGIGILMTRKVKRLGCSGFKDMIETDKLEIVDEDTIIEISTFVAKGQSYEASDGNHDDLVMNLVLFGYFVGTNYFGDLTDINLKQMLFEQNLREIEADILPFGYIENNEEYIQELTDESDPDAPDWRFDPSIHSF